MKSPILIAVQIICNLLIPYSLIGQPKIKEIREVYYTQLRDKKGVEKKRVMDYVDNITRFDTSGNKTEIIWYGEAEGRNIGSSGTGCSWNYNNIRYSIKYFYSDNKIMMDSTYYYKENKIDYLSSYTIYHYDTAKNLLTKTEEYDNENSAREIVLYEYQGSLINRKWEIRYDLYSKKSDTTIIKYLYDRSNNLIMQESKTNKYRSRVEYDYDDKLHLERAYYFDGKTVHPHYIEYMMLNPSGKPIIIEKAILDAAVFIHTTTNITYNDFGDILSEIDTHDYDACELNEPRSMTVYEYEYYK